MKKSLRLFIKTIKICQAQALLESVFAIPLLILLFAGCLQIFQIGFAQIVAKVAVYEAARQVHIDQGDLAKGSQIAVKICRIASPGETYFVDQQGNYTLYHHLQPIFSIIKPITIKQTCPDYVFQTGENQTDGQ